MRTDRLWRVLPVLAGGSALVLVAGSIERLIVDPQLRRLMLALLVWVALARFAIALIRTPHEPASDALGSWTAPPLLSAAVAIRAPPI